MFSSPQAARNMVANNTKKYFHIVYDVNVTPRYFEWKYFSLKYRGRISRLICRSDMTKRNSANYHNPKKSFFWSGTSASSANFEFVRFFIYGMGGHFLENSRLRFEKHNTVAIQRKFCRRKIHSRRRNRQNKCRRFQLLRLGISAATPTWICECCVWLSQWWSYRAFERSWECK